MSFDYIARVGDDTYFRVPTFYHAVYGSQPSAFPRHKAYIGHFKQSNLEDLIATHGEFIQHVPFANGGGWLITSDVAKFVASSHRMLTSRWPEDMVVATWFLGTEVVSIDNLDFIESPCAMTNQTILAHYMQEKHWKMLDDAGMLSCDSDSRDTSSALQ